MLTKFWEGLGDRLAQQVAGRLLSPALVFWIGGFVAWAVSHHGWRNELDAQSRLLRGSSAVLQVVAVALLILGVIGSSVVMERLAPNVRNLLEGNWPIFPKFIGKLRNIESDRFRRRANYWRDMYDKSLDELYAISKDLGRSSQNDPSKLRLMDVISAMYLKIQRFPDQSDHFAPTRLGNILRAADTRPSRMYELDAAVCWPVLWLLLTPEERADVAKARASLDFQAVAWCWSLLFVVWTPWAWWAAPTGLAVCAAIYYGSMLSTAQLYGQLLGACFDLYRDKLYKALRFQLPLDSVAERESGRILTRFLRGDPYLSVSYTYSPNDTTVESE
jgi:hypothetical protein